MSDPGCRCSPHQHTHLVTLTSAGQACGFGSSVEPLRLRWDFGFECPPSARRPVHIGRVGVGPRRSPLTQQRLRFAVGASDGEGSCLGHARL